MTKEEKYTYWLQSAQYDLDTADTVHKGGRWFYVVVMRQQAIEKPCKGLYNFYIDDNVPKIHNIRYILTKIEKTLSEMVDPAVYNLTDELSAHYLNNRYPDFTGQANIEIDKDKATYILEKRRRFSHGY